MKLALLIAVLVAMVAASTQQARAIPTPCTYGAPNGTGSTTLGLSGSTAIVNVAWSFCGVGTSAVIHLGGQTFNGTSAQLGLSPGQCVSASADIYAGGEFWTTQQATPSQVCAPASGGTSSPPPDLSTPLSSAGVTLLYSSDQDNVRLLLNNTPYTCLYRWKLRTYQANYQSAVGGMNFQISYGVCYVPGVKIIFATAWYATAGTHVVSAFSWQNYNDPGFPSVIALTGSATFRWQGSAAMCLSQWGCGPTRHPLLTITFYPNNTEVRYQSVG